MTASSGQISRTNRYYVLFLIAIICALTILNGCGGGHGGGGGTTTSGGLDNAVHNSRGVITLPGGFGLALTSLKVGLPGASAVAADGSFSYNNFGNRPNLIPVTDASGKTVLMGYSDPVSGKPADVSVKASAMALVFFAMDGYSLAPADQLAAQQFILAHASLPGVITAIQTQMATNPTAIGDKDPAILAAIQVAATAISNDSRAVKLRSSRSLALTPTRSANPRALCCTAIGNPSRAVSRAGDLGVQMLVDPSDTLSGVVVQQADDGTGLQITNTYRRPLLYYIQQTGFKNANPDGSAGPAQDLTKQISTGKFPSEYVAATRRLAGAIGGAADVLLGKGAYNPVNSTPVPLTINPPTALESIYHVTVVGPGGDPGKLPKFGAEPYKTGSNEMFALGFFLDILVPSLATIVDVQLDLDSLIDKNMLQGATDLLAFIATTPSIKLALDKGDMKEVLTLVLKAAADDAAFREVLLNRVRDAVLSAASKSDNAKLFLNTIQGASFLSHLNAVIWVLDKALAYADLGAVQHDWASSNWFEEWDVTVIQSKVKLNPLITDISKYDTAPYTASVKGDTTGRVFIYKWSTSGQFGSLYDSAGHTGMSFQSSKDTVAYGPNLAGLGTDTIDVEVLEKISGNDVSLGKAQSKVNVRDFEPMMIPRKASIKPSQTQSFAVAIDPQATDQGTFSYHWKTKGAFGTFLGGMTDIITANKSITYVAKAILGSEDITCEVSATKDGKVTSIGTAKGNLKIEPRQSVVNGSFVPLTVNDNCAGDGFHLPAFDDPNIFSVVVVLDFYDTLYKSRIAATSQFAPGSPSGGWTLNAVGAPAGLFHGWTGVCNSPKGPDFPDAGLVEYLAGRVTNARVEATITYKN
ncbi:MAG: hypothetical protein ABJA67_07050 [Chthonomonadales bacterium]